MIHLITVSFLPLCPSWLKPQGSIFGSRSRDHSSGSVLTSVHSRHGENVDLERAKTLAERQQKAMSKEISRQKAKHKEERAFLRMQLGYVLIHAKELD